MLNPAVPSKPEKTEAPESQKDPQPPAEGKSPKASSEDYGGGRAGISSRDPETSEEPVGSDAATVEEGGRERLKRHRIEMAGRVWIPEIWGQENLLKDWVDCSALDSSLFPKGLVSARKALVEECGRVNTGGLRVENRC